ncbi:hypothetical protein BKA69DRAFT_1043909 [Paraphysoderma sedebokerense]|nr:hypothetical protein BKA69DRAFT_1043909 [Paraphysoderma sedebokerense]
MYVNLEELEKFRANFRVYTLLENATHVCGFGEADTFSAVCLIAGWWSNRFG